jgi:hypothetical protein
MVPVEEVVEYLGQASAAGVVGNGAYTAVARLADWMRETLHWGEREALTQPEGEVAAAMSQFYAEARQEWAPSAAVATQTITIGRDMNAPAINRASNKP